MSTEQISDAERAVRAEEALEEFREQVRTAVIAEAEERGWCEEVNNWLDALGLDPMPKVPQAARVTGAVVVLTDGTIAIRHDDDSEPWRMYEPENDMVMRNRWFDDRDILQVGIASVLTRNGAYQPEDLS